MSVPLSQVKPGVYSSSSQMSPVPHKASPQRRRVVLRIETCNIATFADLQFSPHLGITHSRAS